MSLPREALSAQLRKVSPELDQAGLENAVKGIQRLKEQDPLAVLQDDIFGEGQEGGQLHLMKLAPNFEMAMYLAQATGSCIVTDSAFRWNEIRTAIRSPAIGAPRGLVELAQGIENAVFAFPTDVADIVKFASDKTFAAHPALMRNVFKYLSDLSDRGPKPNWEAHLAASFARAQTSAEVALRKSGVPVNRGRISCAFPAGGIQDNTVNRLLLMSNSERHFPNVPMAFFIERQAGREAEQRAS
jgi:hypothetical protein